ncbi:MAG: hypothetical protein U0353_13190 [Sandaracinus sp.]
MRHPFAPVLVSFALLAGCPTDPVPPGGESWAPARFVVMAEGSGPANEAALEPLRVGARYVTSTFTDTYDWTAISVLRERGGFVEVQRTSLRALRGATRTLELYRRTEAGLETRTAAGDTVLLVPATLRVGLRWQTGSATDPITYEVTAREMARTAAGDAIVWHITDGTRETYYAEGIGRVGGDGYVVDSIVLPDEAAPSPSSPTALETVPLAAGASLAADFLATLTPYGLTAVESRAGALALGVRNAAGGDACLRVEGTSVELETARSAPDTTAPIMRHAEGALEGCLVSPEHEARTPTGGTIIVSQQLRSDASAMTLRSDGTVLYAARSVPNVASYDVSGLTGGIGASIGVFDTSRGPELFTIGANPANDRDGEGLGFIDDVAAYGRGIGSWPLLRAISFGLTQRNVPDIGTWILPVEARLPEAGAPVWYLDGDGLLLRARLSEDDVSPPTPLFHVEGEPSFRFSADAREVWITSADGRIARLVTEEGRERVEQYGRMTLRPGERLIGAVRGADEAHVVALVLDGASAGVSWDGTPFDGGARLYLVTLGSGAPESLPSSLTTSAIASGADAVVCWGETTEPLVREGWTLQGRPAIVEPTGGGAPCALVRRADGASAEDLTSLDAYHVHGPIPGVGMASVTVSSTSPRDFGVPHRDAVPVPGGFVWSTDAWVNGLTVRDRFNDTAAMAPVDLSGGVWYEDRSPSPTALHYWDALGEHVLEADVSIRDMGIATIAGLVVEGGIVYRVRLVSGGDFDGPLYRMDTGGTCTPLAPDGTHFFKYWFEDGMQCELTMSALRCATSDGTAVSSPPGTLVGNLLQRFADGSVLLYAGVPPVRWVRETGTFTRLDDRDLVRVVRATDGSLWGVTRNPEDGTGTVVRVETTGLVDVATPRPSWLAATATPYSVLPGDSSLGVSSLGVIWDDGLRSYPLARYTRP